MDSALRAMLTDTVLHGSFVTQDSYGQPTHSTPVPRACRIDGTAQRFTTAQGEERVSRAQLFFDSETILDLRDLLVLPDGSRPSIQRIDIFQDERGVRDHSRVWL